jgi:antitoxin component of RelBE/YafQ-DinJ toxin-antitoxin module
VTPPAENHTPRRTIRVDVDTWNAALEAAQNQGESLSDVIRAFLKRYIKKNGGKA